MTPRFASLLRWWRLSRRERRAWRAQMARLRTPDPTDAYCDAERKAAALHAATGVPHVVRRDAGGWRVEVAGR